MRRIGPVDASAPNFSAFWWKPWMLSVRVMHGRSRQLGQRRGLVHAVLGHVRYVVHLPPAIVSRPDASMWIV